MNLAAPARIWLLAAAAAALLAPVFAASDARTGQLILTTLLLVAATLAISLPVGAALAWLLVKVRAPLRSPALALTVVWLFLPLYIQAGAWQAAVGLNGWLPGWLGDGGAWLGGWSACIWIHACAAIPWTALWTGIGLRLVEPELEEQALVDAGPGAAMLLAFRRAAPALGAAALWTAVNVANEISVTDLFAVRTFAEELYTQNALTTEPLGPPLALAPAWAMAGGLAALGMAAIAALTPTTSRSPTRTSWTFDLGAGNWLATALTWAILAIGLGLPVISLIIKVGVVVESGPTGLVRTWSLGKGLSAIASMFLVHASGGLRPGRVLVEVGWSLLVGGLAATLAVGIATPAAWAARRGGWAAVCGGALAGGLLAVPGPAIGIALVWLFNSPPALALYDAWNFDWYTQSIAAPVAAQTLRALPWAGLGLWHALRSTPQAALDAAACDGAGPLTQLVWIGLASRRSAVALAWLVALSVGLADLGASLIVQPPGVELLSTWIFRELHFGQEDQVAAAALAALGLSSLLAIASLGLARRLTR